MIAEDENQNFTPVPLNYCTVHFLGAVFDASNASR